MTGRHAILALLLVGAVPTSGCDAGSTKTPSTQPTTGGSGGTDSPPEDDLLPGVSSDPVGEVDDTPEAPTQGHRQRKRMTVEQVRDSMEQVSGGIVWGDEDGSHWDTFAATLGVADYQGRTESDRSPTVLFQKFLYDAAVHTCTEWVDEHPDHFFAVDDPEATDRATVATQLGALRFAIQGRPRTEDSPAVDDALALYASVLGRTDDPTAAWKTVCVALFTHPDFFMY